MSDFSDTIKYAAERGILLDSCGEAERLYWWGLYTDLCGMSVEDALKVQYYHQNGSIDPDKKTNIVNFVMQKGGDGEYSLYLLASYAPTSPVIITFNFDGASQSVTLPVGSTSYNTGIKSSVDATKPYAEIENITLTSDDPSYNYAGKNSVQSGIFTLTINNDGDVTVDSVKYGTVVELPTAPEKEGHSFAWKDSEGVEITGTTITMPEANYTVNGTYTVNAYELSFNITEEYLNSGSIATRTYSAGTLSVDYGEKILDYIAAYAPVREGMTLSSWKTTGGTDIAANFTMPAANFTAENAYQLNSYTLRYVVSGETYDEESYYFGQEIVAVESPTKTGYTFERWDITIPATMPAANLVATAVFTAIDYHIYYIIDGETAYTEVHHYQDAISIRSKEVREGYTFEWNPSSLPAEMPAEDIVVEGTFTAIDYAFKCVADGVDVVSRTYHFGDAIEEVADPSKVGYTFTGWNPSIPATMPSSDLTCVAEFEINSHTITYYVDGTIVTAYTETHNYGEAITIREDDVKEGYTFNGWVPSSLPATMPDEDIVVNGTFSINSYELTYAVNGEPYSSETYEFGAAVTAIAEPEKEGYTFSGWQNVPATMPAQDVEVSGEFTINSYIISYAVNGEPYSSETYEYGAAVTPIAEPSKEGYTFGGWSEIPPTMPAHNVEVSGEFTVNSHTITYIYEAAVYSSETYNYGETIVPIQAPAKEGYTFTEWSGITATMPDNDLTVTAVYEINSHVAEYQIKSGETYEHFTSITYNYGATIVDPVAPERSGYTFAWEAHVATMPDNDIIIKGEYTAAAGSTEIYHDMFQYDITSAITAEILSGSTSYDGGTYKEKTITATIEPSAQCVEWAELRDAELEAYDEDGDDEHLVAADEYQELIDDYSGSSVSRFGFIFAIPGTLTLIHLLGSLGEEKTVETLNTVVIDGTQYTVYRYAPENAAFHQDNTETPHTFTIIVD